LFTIENEADATVITAMDVTGQFEDAQVIQDGELIYIRQWNEKAKVNDLIILTLLQFESILEAQNCEAGCYALEIRNG
jgi:hypothetical protein